MLLVTTSTKTKAVLEADNYGKIVEFSGPPELRSSWNGMWKNGTEMLWGEPVPGVGTAEKLVSITPSDPRFLDALTWQLALRGYDLEKTNG